MSALAQRNEEDLQSGAANDDDISGGPRTRTKYSYDSAGNVLSDGTRTFTYSNSGRLATATVSGVTTTYTYNALGQRVKKATADDVHIFVYDENGHLIGEYDGGANLVEEIVWLDDIPVASIRPGQADGIGVFYVHTDLLNAPTHLTRADDNFTVWRWTHDPYGNGLAIEDPDGNGSIVRFNLRFPGQYYDSETHLNYNDHRYYDPTIGRYLESDPIGLLGESNSTYGYGAGNPVSSIDPQGLATMVITSHALGNNIFGHIAVAITGEGVYSYGTSDPYGGSTTSYLENQFSKRDVTITILNTTPAQEQAMIGFYKKTFGPDSKYSVWGHNCADAALGALDNSKVLDLIMGPVLPSDVGAAVQSLPGAATQTFPKGSSVPSSFQQFNRQ